MESCTEKLARPVAREHPTRAIRAVRRGSEPEDPDLRLRIAEPRHRLTPEGLVRARLASRARDLGPPLTQPPTPLAADDLALALRELSRAPASQRSMRR